MKAIYEVRLGIMTIQINATTWDRIREFARENKWFYVVYYGKKYKYTHAQSFPDRPTRFDFRPLEEGEEEPIYYIYL